MQFDFNHFESWYLRAKASEYCAKNGLLTGPISDPKLDTDTLISKDKPNKTDTTIESYIRQHAIDKGIGGK